MFQDNSFKIIVTDFLYNFLSNNGCLGHIEQLPDPNQSGFWQNSLYLASDTVIAGIKQPGT